MIQLQTSDWDILRQKGISPEQIEEQLRYFSTGFPFLEIRRAAALGSGIERFDEQEEEKLLSEWDDYLKTAVTLLKFVPASGAASRMFKDLFAFLETESGEIEKAFEKTFFEGIARFAFYRELNSACVENCAKDIDTLLAEGNAKAVIRCLLTNPGLNYGALPKGLLKFHTYPSGETRTAFQEHLVEGAAYVAVSGKVCLHFTVSSEHRLLFEKHLEESLPALEKACGLRFEVSFSEQKPATDTLAADANNEAFRDKGQLLFRPGGHGALIENLNDLDADVIFIKNIDNVTPDSMKAISIRYKKLLAAMLIRIQRRCFAYLRALEDGEADSGLLTEISDFCTKTLCIETPEDLQASALKDYLFRKLNRPIRVCGMVKNEGEPGGGPFVAVNPDGSASLQILESSQIDRSKPETEALFRQSSYFNPVDLVCAVKDYRGRKFNLLRYVDKNTGFISHKSKDGRELKALELPGLWNGAMSDWNTLFFEVPVETFNPVKTVNDLLRPEHQ